MEEKITSKQIHPGIFVYRKTTANRTLEYHIQNQRLNTLDFTIDFSGSRGISIQSIQGLQVSTQIPPKKNYQLATLQLEDQWNLSAICKFNLKPPPTELARAVITQQQNSISKKMKLMSRQFEGISLNTISLPSLIKQLNGSNFINPSFPPRESSIFTHSYASPDSIIHWRRPKDIFGDDFSVFPDSFGPHDIQKGELDDIWFVSALAVLTERPEILKRIFMSNKPNLEGVYRLRFCKGGQWVTVTVDDYFPCYPQGMPMYTRSYTNDIWVLLLQKAFAALHGSYMLLRGENTLDGLIDLTGCPVISYQLSTPDVEAMVKNGELWEKIREYQEEGALISGSISSEDRLSDVDTSYISEKDLRDGYAYTVVRTYQNQDQKILKMRNPWPEKEWSGDYQKTSSLWTPELVSTLTPNLESEDGIFWLSYQEFLHRFQVVNICLTKSFHEARLRGKFVRLNIDHRSCVISRWYYCIDIKHHTKLSIVLHQQDQRLPHVQHKRPYLDIGIVILKREYGEQPRVFYYQQNVIERQVQADIELEKGQYIILPRSSGCKLARLPNSQQEYIRLMSGSRLNPIVQSTIRDIFRKFDITVNGDLAYLQLKALFESIGKNLTVTEFEKLRNLHSFSSNGMTVEGLLSYFRKKIIDCGEEKVWKWLTMLGYDQSLFSVKSKPFMLCVHSDQQIKITIKDAIGSGLDKIAMLQLLRLYGNKRNKQSDVDLIVLNQPLAGCVIYGVFNNLTNNSVSPLLDLNQIRGTIQSPQNNRIMFDLPPLSGDIIVHILRVDENCSIKVSFQFTINP